MEVSEISFCSGKGSNIKNNREKSKILEPLFNKYKLSFENTNNIYSTRFQENLTKYEHLVSIITSGSNYWLFLTNIKNRNYSIFIDKKILDGHRFPKMVVTQFRFSPELFRNGGTLFDGELIRNNRNKWEFMINDMILYRGKICKIYKYLDHVAKMTDILKTKYNPDYQIQLCSLSIKKYFTYDDFYHIIDKFIPQCQYRVSGLRFHSLNNNVRDMEFYFKKFDRNNGSADIECLQSNNSLKKSRKTALKLLSDIQLKNEDNDDDADEMENIMLLDMLNDLSYVEEFTEEKLFRFQMKKSDFDNIFILYVLDDQHQLQKHSIARIDTIECAAFANDLFKKTKSEYVNVKCYYDKKFKKWIPSESYSSSKKPHTNQDIYNFVQQTKN